MENLPTKENTSNSLTTGGKINSNATENNTLDLTNIQTPLRNGAQNINETCPPMNQTLATPCLENIMTNDTNNPTPRNNVWKYEAKLSALKSYVQCEISTVHNKIDRLMETFNKTISNFETKSYEILPDKIEFLQYELRYKNEIIKTLIETQTAVLENLLLRKPPQQTQNNTSFHNSPQENVNQLNQNIVFKRQPNQEYNNQTQHHVVNNQHQKDGKQQNRNHYQKYNQEKRLYIGNINKNLKEQDLIKFFGFNATAYLQENCRFELPTGKSGENKGFGFAVMPEHVQKELLKLHGIEFHGNNIVIEKATSTRIKIQDEQNTKRSTTEVVNDSFKDVDLIKANTVPGNRSYADAAISRNTKNSISKKMIVL